MITREQISQGLYDLLLEFNIINTNTYDYEKLRAILIELAKGHNLSSHKP